MKKLLLVVMLFISGLSIAQDTWVVRSVVPEGDVTYSQSVNRYLTQVTDRLCHPGYNIGEVLSYVTLNSNSITIGSDPVIDTGTTYNTVGDYRSNINLISRRGWYNRGLRTGLNGGFDWRQIGQQGDPIPCETRVTEIRDINFSGGDGIEVLSFHYTANKANQFRVWVVDVANGNTPVRVANDREYFQFHGGTVDPVSFSVPQRQIGNAYEIRMAAVSDLDLVTTQEAPIVVGTRILSIDSRGLQFITASNNVGADNIWLDRIHRGDTPSRNRGRFKEGVTTRHWSRAGGKVRRFTINFNDGDLYTYEGIQLNTQRAGDSNRWVRQLNGPRVHFTWRNIASNDAELYLNWRVELPPGWSESGITNPQYRLYSASGDIPWTINNTNISVGDMLSGNYRISNWRYVDNFWELGIRFNYAGRTYGIKLEDHVSHNEDRRRSGDDRTGGLYNQIGGTPWNYDFYSNRNSNGGGHHPGTINFNNSW